LKYLVSALHSLAADKRTVTERESWRDVVLGVIWEPEDWGFRTHDEQPWLSK